jgi:ATP/maltotriose-dependent transcriptional regulator MalT
LAAITGGHAGALVLACEFLRSTGGKHEGSADVVTQIHQHVLERLLERMAPARRELLLQTALAPCFDAALAAALAGEEAARELDTLARQGILRCQASTRGEIYEAHGLVRQGARASLRSREGEEGVRTLAMKTADLLEAHGQPEDAFELLIEFRAQERAAQVLEPLAAKRARSGEAALVSRAAERLDDDVLVRHPWLCFWVGRVLQGIDEERARNWFERSYAGFAAAGDASGMRIAAASVVIAFVIEYGDIRTLETWLRRHVETGGEHPVEQGSAHEATLCMGVICAALNAGAHPATIDANAVTRRLQVLLDDPSVWLTRDQAVEAARLLLDHARVFAKREQSQAMVLATQRHVNDVEAGPLQRGRWFLSAANAYLGDGKQDIAERYMQQARTLAEQSGSRRLGFDIAQGEVNAAQAKGDLAAAIAHLARMEAHIVTAPPAQRAEYARLTGRAMLLQHKYAEGLRWAEEALDLANQAGYRGAAARVFELECVYALAAGGRIAEAAQLARTMASRLQGTQFVCADAITHCLDFLGDDMRDMEMLRRGLQQAERAGFVYMLARAGSCLPILCNQALEPARHFFLISI